MRLYKTQSGFTLVELAIALMVIGLLIGGVLKGQELVENARVTQVIRQANAFKTAAIIFRNTYGKIPGDLTNPTARIPDCTADPCNFAGNGNSRLDSTPAFYPYTMSFMYFTYGESRNFFVHMAKAGLITGMNPAATSASLTDYGQELPAGPYSGNGWAASYFTDSIGTNLPSGNYLIFSNIDIENSTMALKASAAAQIDRKADDGKPNSGDIRALGDAGNGTAADFGCTSADTVNGIYNETSSSETCNMLFPL